MVTYDLENSLRIIQFYKKKENIRVEKKKKKDKKKSAQKKNINPTLPIVFDKIIHEPNRLRLMAQLYVVEIADMVFLQHQLDLTWGNLSSHLTKLEKEGYVFIKKEIFEKKSRTTIKITELGQQQFLRYRKQMKALLE